MSVHPTARGPISSWSSFGGLAVRVESPNRLRGYQPTWNWFKNIHFGAKTNQCWNVYAPINRQYVSISLLILNDWCLVAEQYVFWLLLLIASAFLRRSWSIPSKHNPSRSPGIKSGTECEEVPRHTSCICLFTEQTQIEKFETCWIIFVYICAS